MSSDPTAKVLFRVPDDEGGANIETLWATPVGDDQYKLDNSPFYAYGVSCEDTVFAPFNEQEGMPTFQAVVARAGNRTIRVIFDPHIFDGRASDLILQRLVSLGCNYEGANRGYISVNIPPAVKLQHVHSYLIEVDAQWEQADPTDDSLLPNGA